MIQFSYLRAQEKNKKNVMPYRRLPNTDQARLRAIEAALEKGKRIPTPSLAFNYQTLERLQGLYPRLLNSIRQLEIAKQNQFNKSQEYGEILRKVKLYLSHFVQVLTFAVIREELKPEVREFYGLDPAKSDIPSMKLEEDILEWGEKIITGEQKRCQKGGNPIYSPSIALVKVHYDFFNDAYKNQKFLQNMTNKASERMMEIRDETDKLIQHTWNEIEATFKNQPELEMRENASSYGVVYVFRPSELKKAEQN